MLKFGDVLSRWEQATVGDGGWRDSGMCNTTGAILTLPILMLGPVSGAHFNPAASIAFALRRELTWSDAATYIACQVAGGIIGVIAAHTMFDLPLWQVSQTVRSGTGQWFAEGVASFGLLLTILGCIHCARASVPYAVGLFTATRASTRSRRKTWTTASRRGLELTSLETSRLQVHFSETE
jgi:glycerol uptake facilitator-like aquaporin